MLVAQGVGAALDHTDLVAEPLDEVCRIILLLFKITSTASIRFKAVRGTPHSHPLGIGGLWENWKGPNVR